MILVGSYLVGGLVPGLELGLLELEPDSLEDCRCADPPRNPVERGSVEHDGDRHGVELPCSLVLFK